MSVHACGYDPRNDCQACEAEEHEAESGLPHTITTDDGWVCSVCGEPINGYPGGDESIRHV